MDVLNHLQKVRELSRIPERASVAIGVAVPSRVEVDVLEAMRREAGGAHGIGLRENILLIHHAAGGNDGLLAVGAPALEGTLAQAVDLRQCCRSQGEERSGNGRGYASASMKGWVAVAVGVELLRSKGVCRRHRHSPQIECSISKMK
jgi:hypothetical protein